MKLSRRARYALRMMVAIARQTKEEKRISLTQVAKLTDLSRRYLEQLAIALKNSSLIIGKTGKSGGYMLSRPAADIKVGEIVEAAIGPINIVECLAQPDLCILATDCECRWLSILVSVTTGMRRTSRLVKCRNCVPIAETGRFWKHKTVVYWF